MLIQRFATFKDKLTCFIFGHIFETKQKYWEKYTYCIRCQKFKKQ